MSIAASAVDGIHQASALLGYSADRLVGHAAASNTDVVSLSDVAIAMIQARIGVTANASALHVVLKMEEALIDVIA
jgi:hypothetical protein